MWIYIDIYSNHGVLYYSKTIFSFDINNKDCIYALKGCHLLIPIKVNLFYFNFKPLIDILVTSVELQLLALTLVAHIYFLQDISNFINDQSDTNYSSSTRHTLK